MYYYKEFKTLLIYRLFLFPGVLKQLHAPKKKSLEINFSKLMERQRLNFRDWLSSRFSESNWYISMLVNQSGSSCFKKGNSETVISLQFVSLDGGSICDLKAQGASISILLSLLLSLCGNKITVH